MESDHDPVRADTITSRLEVIPEELIPRYEKLRSGAEDQFEGCAICRDAFIEEHFPELPSPKKGSTAAFLSELPFDKMRIPDILAFPCPGMHIFHENCIYPWLARKTTCPTCRFDVDPDSLTLRIHRNLRRPGERPRTRKPWEPPKGPAFLSWLERAEDKKNGLPVSPTPTPTLNGMYSCIP